jgi:hypothetical protein
MHAILRFKPPGRWVISAVVLGVGALAVAALPGPEPRLQPVASATPAASDVVVPPTKGAGGYWQVNFNYLTSYDYQAPGAASFEPVKPAPGRTDGIPKNIRELDGRPVRLEGFMMPLAVEKDGSVKEFLIMRSVLTCCFGATPMPTEWVVVRPGKKSAKVKPTMDVPLAFFGKFHVGELYRDGLFAGIYELELDRVSNP